MIASDLSSVLVRGAMEKDIYVVVILFGEQYYTYSSGATKEMATSKQRFRTRSKELPNSLKQFSECD